MAKPTNKDKKKVTAKAGQSAEDLAAIAAAAEAGDDLEAGDVDEDEDDLEASTTDDMECDEDADGDAEEEEEEEEPVAKKKKKATAAALPASVPAPSAAAQIADLCMIAGMDNLTGKFIRKGYSVAQVQGFLKKRRVELSAKNPVNSGFSGAGKTGATSIDRAIQQARATAASSNGAISASKAMETILSANPDIYEDYDDERKRISTQGTNREMAAYVQNHQMRYARSLGLSTAVDSVPGR